MNYEDYVLKKAGELKLKPIHVHILLGVHMYSFECSDPPQELIEQGYILPSGILTNKFTRLFIDVAEFKVVVDFEDVDAFIDKFFLETEIPYKVKTDKGDYAIRVKSPELRKMFKSVIIPKVKSKELNYKKLVAGTRKYYAQKGIYQKTVTNFFKENEWIAWYTSANEIDTDNYIYG